MRPAIVLASALVCAALAACGWDPSRPIREQEGFSDHATFMDGLVEQGFVLLGGPFKDGERSLLIVNGPDDQAVRQCLAGDPWATAGMLSPRFAV